MQTKYLLTFVVIAVLVGAIVSMTASGIFAQTKNTSNVSNQNTENNGASINTVSAQQEQDIDDVGEVDDEEDADDEAEDEDDNEFTSSFRTENCTFTSTGRTLFSILEPGYQLVLAGEEDGEQVELVITVLDETKVVDGTETRVVEERETVDGELVEVSRNFFAICEETSNVFYFGEEVDDYEDGEIVSHDGEWLAGEDNATAGIIMPGTVLLGARYYQEVAPGVALDRAEIMEDDEELETPAGTFENVVVIRETTPLEPDAIEFKYHVAGIGLVQDADLKLEEYGFVE